MSMTMSTNKCNNAAYKYLSDTTINILNIIKTHIEIPELLGLVGNFLETKFDPRKYDHVISHIKYSNESNDQYRRDDYNFYETFDFPIELKFGRTNHRFKIMYYLLHKLRSVDPKCVLIGIAIHFYNNVYDGRSYTLHFVLPIKDIVQINIITQYKKFHECLQRYDNLYNNEYRHFFRECSVTNEINCKDLWHIWNCELKSAITYFINCREKLIQAGAIPQNGIGSLAWTQTGYEVIINNL